MKTLILGMGNTLLSDDGIGILTKRYLGKRLNTISNIDFCETSWGGFKIIDLLKGYDYSIIIDSIKTKLKPIGFIHHLKPIDLLPTLRLTSYHDINFITALKLADELGTPIPKEIEILAIEIDNNETISECIHPKLRESIPLCSEMIYDLLASQKIIHKSNSLKVLANQLSDNELKALYKEDLAEESEIDNKIKILEEYQV